MTTRHNCHAMFCKRACPPRLLMCRECWAMVSPETQREVYRTVKMRSTSGADHTWAPWWRASHQAIAEVARQTRERFEPQWFDGGGVDRWLAKEMRIADDLETGR